MSDSKIFFILWCSGSWKSTVIKNILKLEKPDIQYVSSYSSRQMRPWEEQWKPYFFITREEFEKSIQDGEFLEYALVHNLAYYWTKKSSVLEPVNQGINVIKEIDIQWLINIKDSGQISWIYKSVFISLTPDELVKRITQRCELASQELEQRIESFKKENELAKQYCDYIINWDRTREQMVEVMLDLIYK